MRVYEDDRFTLEHSEECTVPGYLVLRMRAKDAALPRLDDRDAERLGALLARAAQAISAATGAERVYCLSFCEVDARLHFHLFPRTRWLLDAYHEATGTGGEPVNGPALFEWARRRFSAGAGLPASQGDPASTLARMREALATALGPSGG
jgi:diadenosine tetraphosphate (Ap4A) HIT family hydrolase